MIELENNWKTQLMEHCYSAISELPDEDPVDGNLVDDTGELPSLYTFYSELLAMRNEVRKVNRRTAETFGDFGDVLDGMRSDGGKLREHLSAQSSAAERKSGISRNLALSMVDLLDRVWRLEKISSAHSQKGWSGIFSAKEYAENQSGAISILANHLQQLLEKSEVQAIRVRAGDVYDPLYMKAVNQPNSSNGDSNEAPSQLVIVEEHLAGYRMGEQCLRPAEVSLKRQKTISKLS